MGQASSPPAIRSASEVSTPTGRVTLCAAPQAKVRRARAAARAHRRPRTREAALRRERLAGGCRTTTAQGALPSGANVSSSFGGEPSACRSPDAAVHVASRQPPTSSAAHHELPDPAAPHPRTLPRRPLGLDASTWPLASTRSAKPVRPRRRCSSIPPKSRRSGRKVLADDADHLPVQLRNGTSSCTTAPRGSSTSSDMRGRPVASTSSTSGRAALNLGKRAARLDREHVQLAIEQEDRLAVAERLVRGADEAPLLGEVGVTEAGGQRRREPLERLEIGGEPLVEVRGNRARGALRPARIRSSKPRIQYSPAAAMSTIGKKIPIPMSRYTRVRSEIPPGAVLPVLPVLALAALIAPAPVKAVRDPYQLVEIPSRAQHDRPARPRSRSLLPGTPSTSTDASVAGRPPTAARRELRMVRSARRAASISSPASVAAMSSPAPPSRAENVSRTESATARDAELDGGQASRAG